ncbi:helix-turn-helix transcriptional regulator [Pararhodobacter sp.]|uniref:helix-turn-helix domain-containing protein n=1 Tax=Pararhodobacter sp. TaxID=2127056 RepID=UPI002AFE0FAB|nr:helix-turn-helix transcriptional regulator [Pararhodobacter sp.]
MAIREPNGRWKVAKLPSGDWHPEEIKAAVRMLGSTLYALSRDAGLPEHACRSALRRSHFDGEFAIAEFLGVSPRQVWPSRYRADGSRIPAIRYRPLITTDQMISPDQPERHRQNAAAV